jgi:hypothetical protein
MNYSLLPACSHGIDSHPDYSRELIELSFFRQNSSRKRRKMHRCDGGIEGEMSGIFAQVFS